MAKVRYSRRPDLEELVYELINHLGLYWVRKEYVRVVESYGSKSRAYARIYGLPKTFQAAYSLPPLYVIEVISENFNKINRKEQIKVLIHELMHLPKKFGGGLRPHGPHTSKEKISELYRLFLERSRSSKQQ